MRYQRKPAFITCLCAVSCFLIITPPLFSQPDQTQMLDISLFSSQDKVHPGSLLKIAMAIEIESGWHINSSVPMNDFLIPSSVSVPKESPVKLEKTIFPEPVEIVPQFSQEVMSVYMGEIWIGVVTAVPEDMESGPLTIKLHFRYQGCDDQACYAPNMKAACLTIPVVDRSTPVYEIHPEIFSRIDFGKKVKSEGMTWMSSQILPKESPCI